MNEDSVANKNTDQLIENKSQRSENYPQVKTGRKYESFKSGRVKGELEES